MNSSFRLDLRHWGPVLAVAAAALLLAACGQTATAIPTATVPAPTRTPVPTFTAIPTATIVPTITPSPTPANIDPLSGEPVSDTSLIHRRVLAVRVGNDPEIRPQEGLGAAEIVYEEVMDGWWVTRFTALYLVPDVERIRPIRSARLSSLAIAPQYQAALVHSGASDEIRWRLSQATGFVNLDEYYNSAPYALASGYDWRGRLYTTTAGLRAYLEEKGLENDTVIPGYLFSTQAPRGATATDVTIPYPTAATVEWRYDAAAGHYLRTVAGEPHLDGLTGEQLTADNIIVLYAEHRATDIVEDVQGATAIDIVLSGEGRAQVIRDGVAVEATWRQDEPGTLIRYYNAAGDEIALRQGHTWIELVPLDYEVTLTAD